MVIKSAEPSTIEASTTCPFPELLVSNKADTSPNASNIPPPPKSPIKFNGGTGGDPGLPIVDNTPEREI